MSEPGEFIKCSEENLSLYEIYWFAKRVVRIYTGTIERVFKGLRPLDSFTRVLVNFGYLYVLSLPHSLAKIFRCADIFLSCVEVSLRVIIH